MADIDFGSVSSDIKHYEETFRFAHLPDGLKKISQPCGQLAQQMVGELAMLNSSSDKELEMGLRKLLEAKDAFVRALAIHNNS